MWRALNGVLAAALPAAAPDGRAVAAVVTDARTAWSASP
jgi:hypothetical protein